MDGMLEIKPRVFCSASDIVPHMMPPLTQSGYTEWKEWVVGSSRAAMTLLGVNPISVNFLMALNSKTVGN